VHNRRNVCWHEKCYLFGCCISCNHTKREQPCSYCGACYSPIPCITHQSPLDHNLYIKTETLNAAESQNDQGQSPHFSACCIARSMTTQLPTSIRSTTIAATIVVQAASTNCCWKALRTTTGLMHQPMSLPTAVRQGIRTSSSQPHHITDLQPPHVADHKLARQAQVDTRQSSILLMSIVAGPARFFPSALKQLPWQGQLNSLS
jgi:hypothetical protein